MNRILFVILIIFSFTCPAIARSASQSDLIANQAMPQTSSESAQPVKPPETPPTVPSSSPAANQVAPPVASESAQTVQPPETAPAPIYAPYAPVPPPLMPQASSQATPEEPSLGIKIVDVALVRPLCVVGSTVSTAVYIAISPLAFIIGLGEPAARAMVEAPWRFTAFRYVGEFDHYKDEQPIMGVWDFL